MTDSVEKDVLGYTTQGVEQSAIAELVGCEESDVPELLEKSLVALSQQHGGVVATPILVELKRLDTLIEVMTRDLMEVQDEYCEVKGNLIRDAFTHRQKISDNIRKLVEAKVKLLQLSLTYKVIKDSEEEDKLDTSNLTLQEKLTLFRDLLQ
jgi:hypothetical protein